MRPITTSGAQAPKILGTLTPG